MVVLVIIGLIAILLEGLINVIELRRFFAALAVLNHHTRTFGDKMLYPIRFLRLIPLLAPLIPDIILIGAGGIIGLGGGVMGAIISIGGSCLILLMIKAVLHINKIRAADSASSFEEDLAKAIGRH